MNAILSFERRHVVVTTVANRKRHARTRHRLGRVLEVLDVLELEHAHDWGDSEMEDSPLIGELTNGAKTKAGPLEAEQLSRLGNIALVR